MNFELNLVGIYFVVFVLMNEDCIDFIVFDLVVKKMERLNGIREFDICSYEWLND